MFIYEYRAIVTGKNGDSLRSSDGASHIQDISSVVSHEVLHRRRDHRLQFRVLRQILHTLSHKSDTEVDVGQPGSSRVDRKREQQRQAIRQVRQHADERHHFPAGRESGVAEAHTRDAGAHVGRERVGRAHPGAAAVEDAATGDGRETGEVLPHACQGDRRHVSLPDDRHQGAVSTAGTGRPVVCHVELQFATVVRTQVQKSASEETTEVRLATEDNAQPTS